MPYKELLTGVVPEQGLVVAATVHLVFMFAAAVNLVIDKFSPKMRNSIAKVMNLISKAANSIANRTNSIAKVTNSIAKVTNLIAKTCKVLKEWTHHTWVIKLSSGLAQYLPSP